MPQVKLLVWLGKPGGGAHIQVEVDCAHDAIATLFIH